MFLDYGNGINVNFRKQEVIQRPEYSRDLFIRNRLKAACLDDLPVPLIPTLPVFGSQGQQ
jgi:hypothetical protein